ncbi:carotenoid oxygenase family protein [Shewanella cyperi]|uniref:carotenoid oxygenase family protein n=1 Tax=Shewanella cyperi TaxID=2814292 RepID=UPI001A94D760|nr:carotenoid oxygenase family protein [Shewanella cyperi]QSX41247.1 carotenoid oxygenase family protein [Shewanella cyperi]
MDRRQFLRGSGAVLGAALWGGVADKVLALGGTEILARQPWAKGFDGVEQDLPLLEMTCSGDWPRSLEGNLYRNGPARFSRQGFHYRHWFDGDGMVQQFRIQQGGIRHQGRFVRTHKFQAEQAAGRFLYNAAGTAVPGALPVRNNDDANVANTALLPRNGELLALWEAGSPYRLDGDSLETLGVKSFGDKFKGLPFSAHPLVDGVGGLWNFGCWYVGGDKDLLLYHIAPDDSVAAMEVINLPQAGYIHAFAQSQTKLLFYVSSCVYEEGDTYVGSFRWRPELGAKLLVIDKADLSRQQWRDLPPGFVFHFGQALESEGELLLQLSLYSDSAILTRGMQALLTGQVREQSPDAEWATIRVGLDGSGKLQGEPAITRSGIHMEFPQFEASATPTRLETVFGIGASDHSASGLSDTLYAMGGNGERKQCYLGPDRILEEPLYLPATPERAAMVLMTWLDYRQGRTGLSLFSAADISRGPIAEASMDRVLPLGFHGCFA